MYIYNFLGNPGEDRVLYFFKSKFQFDNIHKMKIQMNKCVLRCPHTAAVAVVVAATAKCNRTQFYRHRSGTTKTKEFYHYRCSVWRPLCLRFVAKRISPQSYNI